jgi:hypothetical protein
MFKKDQASLLSTTMTTGTNLPTPPSILTVRKAQKGIVQSYHLQTLPKPLPPSPKCVWKDAESVLYLYVNKL